MHIPESSIIIRDHFPSRGFRHLSQEVCEKAPGNQNINLGAKETVVCCDRVGRGAGGGAKLSVSPHG